MSWFEKKGLRNQMQRVVVNIASNIVEGAERLTDADFAFFLDHALGSSNKVETQMIISNNKIIFQLSKFQYCSIISAKFKNS